MSKDKETKKLESEELEKREAPFMPIVNRPDVGSGGGVDRGGRAIAPEPAGGGGTPNPGPLDVPQT